MSILSVVLAVGLQAAATGSISDRIESLWALNPSLESAKIDASVEGDHVILDGRVDTAAQRETAERLAKRVKGVTKVDNRITVGEPGPVERAVDATKEAVKATPRKIDETWITTKIASKINADDALEDVDVDVKVKKDVVTITGIVPSRELRDRVLRHARETDGVSKVIDKMTIR